MTTSIITSSVAAAALAVPTSADNPHIHRGYTQVHSPLIPVCYSLDMPIAINDNEVIVRAGMRETVGPCVNNNIIYMMASL